MSEWILEIKDGSYADHEYVCDEWHRVELDLNDAKMTPLIHCSDCRHFKEWCRACSNDRLVEANGAVFLSVDPDWFCSQAKPKEEA